MLAIVEYPARDALVRSGTFRQARPDFSRFADGNGPGDRAENPPLALLVVTKPEVRTIQLPLARTEESDYRSP